MNWHWSGVSERVGSKLSWLVTTPHEEMIVLWMRNCMFVPRICGGQGPGSMPRFRVVLNGDQRCGQAASRLELCLHRQGQSCVITNQQTIANNTCTRVYVLDGAWSVIYGLTINAVINEDCGESRLRPGSSHAPAARTKPQDSVLLLTRFIILYWSQVWCRPGSYHDQ